MLVFLLECGASLRALPLRCFAMYDQWRISCIKLQYLRLWQLWNFCQFFYVHLHTGAGIAPKSHLLYIRDVYLIFVSSHMPISPPSLSGIP